MADNKMKKNYFVSYRKTNYSSDVEIWEARISAENKDEAEAYILRTYPHSVIVKTEEKHTPLFTTKHYKAIAEVIKEIDNDLGNYFGFSSQDRETKAKIWRDIVGRMSNKFGEDNSKFDVSKFLKQVSK